MDDARAAGDVATAGGGQAASGLVTTVLGDIPVGRLGPVDAHEHLFLRTPALPGDEFVDLDPMVIEVAAVKASGIDTVVDLTPIGLGRDPRGLAAVSERTGVQVIAATGFHREAHYPGGHWARREPVETLVEIMLADLTQGVDARDWQGPLPSPTPHRAGVVKLGASYQRISAAEARWFEAGAEVASRCGVPVAVHCEIGTMGHEALDRLATGGVAADRVLLAHLDRNPDPGLHGELAARGAYLLYDTVGRIKYRPDSVLLDLIAAVGEAGHGDRILLGTDVGRRSMLSSLGGGPGMAMLGTTFLPRLAAARGEETVHAIMRVNPARALAQAEP